MRAQYNNKGPHKSEAMELEPEKEMQSWKQGSKWCEEPARSQGVQTVSSSWKQQGVDSPLELLGKGHPDTILILASLDSFLNFWHLELWDEEVVF